MNKKIAFILAAFFIAVLGGVVYASDVTNADYMTKVTVSNNTTAQTGKVATFTLSTADMIAADMLNSSANDCAMKTGLSGTDIPFMPSVNATYPWCSFVNSIGASTSQFQYLYSKGVTGGAIRYFPGVTGMAVSDHTTIEIGNDGAVSFDNIYLDTTKDDIIFSKGIEINAKTISNGNVTVSLTSNKALDFEQGNSDYVSVPDSNDYSFTNGAGTDMPFTIMGWVKPENNAGTQMLVGKAYTAATLEWGVSLQPTGEFYFFLSNTNLSAYIRKTSVAQLPDASYSHIAVTYSGSETLTGMKMYLDGELLTNTTNVSVGAYAGMANTTSLLEFGRQYGGGGAGNFLDGVLSNWKIYKNRVLSEAEILADYNGISPSSTNLVGWYKFIDGAGNPTDSSGLAHNASANTADWVTTGGKAYETFLSHALVPGEKDNFTVSVNATSGNLEMWIDGTLVSSVSMNGTSITNNANAYQFGSSTGTPYFESVSVTVNGTLQSKWKWRYATTFNDIGIRSNTGTPSFRTASSPGISASVTSSEGTYEGTIPLVETGEGWTMITAVPVAPSGMFTDGGTGFPLGPQISTAATAAGDEPENWIILFAFGIAIFVFVLVYGVTHSTRLGQRGSLILASLCAEIVLVYFYIVGGISGLSLIPAGLILVFLIFWRKSSAPVD